MYQQDWLDELRWGAVALGVIVALVAQVALTLAVLQPLDLLVTWAAVALVEGCVALGAFVAGWRASTAIVKNSVIAALVSAAISLAATVFSAPAQINLINVAFTLGTFSMMGVLGGMSASLLRTRALVR